MKFAALTVVTFLLLAILPENAAKDGQLELVEDEEKLQLNAVKEELNFKLDALQKEEAIKMKAVNDEKKIQIEELNGMAKKTTKTNNMVDEKGDLEMTMEYDPSSEMMENNIEMKTINDEKKIQIEELNGMAKKMTKTDNMVDEEGDLEMTEYDPKSDMMNEKTNLRSVRGDLDMRLEYDPKSDIMGGNGNFEHKFESRIVGGTEAAPDEFPFMVHYTPITDFGEFVCGGSLISPNIVLTAAHCWAENGRVRVGSMQPNSGGAVAGVAGSVLHPDYDPETAENDYMILKLDRDIDTNDYPPIELNFNSNVPSTGDSLTVIGFGTTSESGLLADDLLKVEVPVVSTEDCQHQYSMFGPDAIKKDIHLCAGFPQGGKDSCQGDSGGPIFKQIDGVQKQVGVVSWGIGCAREGFSGVYARVSGASSWIKSESCSRSSEPKPSFCNTGSNPGTAPIQSHNRWDQVDGKLKWTSISKNSKHVWGVNSNDYIYYRNGANGNWVNIAGRLKQVSVSADGKHIWGVNSGDYIYYRNGKNGNWVNIAGRLKQVSVSADGQHVWGVNSGDYIYYRNGKNGNWSNIGGRLKQVSVSGDGQHVWGVNSSDKIYYRNGKNGSWVQIRGRLKQISVSDDGEHVWGVNSGDYIYYRNGKTGSWKNIAGRLKQVSVSADGGYVWGVNSGDNIYKRI